MSDHNNTFIHTLFASQQRSFFIKAGLLFCALLVISYAIPQVPGVVVAVFWVLVTALSAIGFAYFYVVRKTEKQIAKFREGGKLADFNNGRKLCLFVAFVVSAVFSTSLLLNSAKWELHSWLLLVFSIPLYYFTAQKISVHVNREYKPLFQEAGIVKLTFWIVVVVLCALALLITFLFPSASYSSVLDALHAAKDPFAHSSSPLVADAGYFALVSELLATYGIPKTVQVAFGEFPFVVTIVGSLLIYISIFVGFVSLLNVCYITPRELRRVFSPLYTEALEQEKPIQKNSVVLSVVFSLALVVAFMGVDAHFSQVKQERGYTSLEALTLRALDGIAYIADGENLSEQFSDRVMQGLQSYTDEEEK